MPDVSNMDRLVRVNACLARKVTDLPKICLKPRVYQDSIGEAAWLAEQFDPEVSFVSK
jgi:hypothetical protein